MNRSLDLSATDDAQLLEALGQLVARDRSLTAELLAHLGEVDARKLYAEQAYSSMFDYCTRRLRMSADVAAQRVYVARAARQHPAILRLVEDGSLTLSAVRVLAPHLEPHNQEELLKEAIGLSVREVEKLVAAWFPQPDAPALVRKLPSRTPAAARAAGATRHVSREQQSVTSTLPVTAPQTPLPPPAARRRDVIAPTAAQRYKIQFTADAQLHDKLRRAQDLLSHAIPSGDLAELFDRALTLLVEDAERKRFGKKRARRQKAKTQDQAKQDGPASEAAAPAQTEESRRQGTGRSRNVALPVKREVWERDGGQCTFRDAEGQRCQARRHLELHHCEPYAHGGSHDADNITLRCAAHNQHAAVRDFGPDKMDRYRRRPGRDHANREAEPEHAARHVKGESARDSGPWDAPPRERVSGGRVDGLRSRGRRGGRKCTSSGRTF